MLLLLIAGTGDPAHAENWPHWCGPLRVLQRNDLGERIVASPAVSDGRIFIRTDESLIAVGG